MRGQGLWKRKGYIHKKFCGGSEIRKMKQIIGENSIFTNKIRFGKRAFLNHRKIQQNTLFFIFVSGNQLKFA